jgi:ubiquinone/menaquinone biosynthesis C-methylase UbiE
VSHGSLSFDRAADFYDSTRGLTAEARAQVTELLDRELERRWPVLEIGVGTGRIALPLHEAGVDMSGIDISELMLRRLIHNAGGRLPFPVARADATAVPFRDNSFGGGIASHVLHLIPEWETALREVVRVIAPRGIFLSDHGEWHGVFLELGQHFSRLAGIGRANRGVNEPHEIDDAMASLGATCRVLPEIVMHKTNTYDGIISDLENGLWSRSWQLTAEARKEAGTELRRWAERRYGDLGQEVDIQSKIVWRAYDLP